MIVAAVGNEWYAWYNIAAAKTVKTIFVGRNPDLPISGRNKGFASTPYPLVIKK